MSLGLGAFWTQAQAQVIVAITEILSMLRVVWHWSFLKKDKKKLAWSHNFYNPHWATFSAKTSLAMKLFKFKKKPKLGHGFFWPNPSSILGAKSSSTRNKNPSPSLNFHLQGFEKRSEAWISFSSLTEFELDLDLKLELQAELKLNFFCSKKVGAKGRKTHLSMKLLQIGLSHLGALFTFSFFLQTQMQNKNDF